MIKVNLLPKYYGEGKRILITIIVCVVILMIEAVPVLKVPADYKVWTDWFAPEKGFYGTYVSDAQAEIDITDKWKNEAGTYKKFISSMSRDATQKYNNGIVESLKDVSDRVGGGGAYFDDMTIEGSNVKMTGKIKGLMNFVNYYFKLSKNDLKLEPMAEPYPESMDKQIIAVDVSGTLKKAMPTQPAFDFTTEDYGKLYVPKGGTSAAPVNVGGGGGAAAGGAAGAAPAAGGEAPAGGAPAAGGAAPAGGAPPAGGAAPPAGGAAPPAGAGGPPAGKTP